MIAEFTKDMAIIQKLDDQPNDVGGLTAAELKAKFDEGGLALQEYLNETLLPSIGSGSGAENLGALDKDGAASTVQAELDKVSNLGGADATAADLDEAVSESHTHANKALLDAYTQTEANLADAVAKRHTHGNQGVLDGISAVTTALGSATDKVPSEKAVSDAIANAGLLPPGGQAGQALVKTSGASFDVSWGTPELPGKADKVSGAASGNFAALDSNGNLADSGKKPGDFAPAPLTANLTLYVNAATGSDSNPGTQSQPLATIPAAINLVPKNLGGYTATINIAAGTYPAGIRIEGFYGGNALNMYGIRLIGESADTVFLTGGVSCLGCRIPILIQTLSVSGTYFSNNVSAKQCFHLHIIGLNIDGSAAPIYSILLEQTNGSILNMQVSNAPGAAIALNQCIGYMNNISGSNNAVGVLVGNEGTALPALAIIGQNTISATTQYQKIRGGAIIQNGVLV